MSFPRRAAWLLVSACVLACTGCSLTGTVPTSSSQPSVTIHGVLHGGQQPVVGAQLYLLAPGNGTYGGYGIPASTANASVSMLNSGVLSNNVGSSGQDSTLGYYVTTAADGSFSISGDYSCTSGFLQSNGGTVTLTGSEPVYLYAVGGNPGAGVNSTAGFMASLGPCSGLSSSTAVFMNEVTTVALAYAAAGFASDATHISSSGTALAATGIANAFANTTSLVNLPTGTALSTTPAGYGTVPQSLLYTLANILAVCINSTGSASPQCSGLLGTATSTGDNTGNTPADTATAAIYIAQNPGANVGPLYFLPNGVNAFGGGLSGANPPNDLTVAINYAYGNIYDPAGVTIDASGNAWVPNAQTYNNYSLTEISPLGSVRGTVPFANPTSLAIDAGGTLWMNCTLNCHLSHLSPLSIFQIGSTGTTENQYQSAIFQTPQGNMAVDASGNIWMPYQNGALLWYVPQANNLSPLVLANSNLGNPIGAVVDTYGNTWIADTAGDLDEVTYTTADLQAGNFNITFGTTASQPLSMTLDSGNNLWVGNSDNSITQLVPGNGFNLANNYSSFGGINQPAAIAVDSNGFVWTANGNNSVSQVAGTGPNVGTAAQSPSTGFTGGSTANLNQPSGLAIDGSGNVWVSNAGNNTVTEFIGIAGPVVTPVVANLLPPYTLIASKP